ncbi:MULTISPECIES: DUF6781 family protein [Methylobacter]|uniref:DUF6781 family protein n=1 Tax=Methylobacter TaxID=429 RepID=UPI0003687746
MTELNRQQDVQEAVRDAVDSGSDIYRRVKDITLKALTERRLDMENISNVADAVSKGIGEGMGSQGEYSKEAFTQAVSALDDALATAAEASKLAIQEAASKVSDYSQHDFNKAADDIQQLEELFLGTVKKIAKDSNQIIADIVNDFTTHARQSGTAVGQQASIAMDALKGLPRISKDTLISSTVAATSALAEIGSGILSGIAESLRSSQAKK